MSELGPEELATVNLFLENSPSVVNISNIATARNTFTMDVLKIPQVRLECRVLLLVDMKRMLHFARLWHRGVPRLCCVCLSCVVASAVACKRPCKRNRPGQVSSSCNSTTS